MMTDISRPDSGRRARCFMQPLIFPAALCVCLYGGGAFAEPLLIMTPDLPGASETGGVGRDVDIIRQVLALCGYETEFVAHPFGRHLKTYQDVHRYDAVTTVPLSADLQGSGTAAYVWYQNGAFYDTNRVGTIESVKDLAGLHLVTFRDGIELLELDELAPDTGSVLEIDDLHTHTKLLMLGRVDAVLADGFIIAEVIRRNMESADFRSQYGNGAQLRFAPIFTPLPYKVVFREAAMAEEFDLCFSAAVSGHVIQNIHERHLGPLQHQLRHSYLGF